MNPRAGGWCWAGLFVLVAVADAVLIRTDRPTMSEVFGDALRHPLRRWPTTLVWGLLTIHLFTEFMPSRIRPFLARLDPLGNIARLISM